MRVTASATWSQDPRRLRRLVVAAGLVSTVLKLLLAARTFGTNDVHYWAMFAQGVRDRGPVGIYGIPSLVFYNHPPLAGWFLVAVNRVVDLGLPFPFVIRAPACLADAGSTLLLFEILRHRRTAREATAAAVLFAASPLMLIVSGFHGNTDPVFIFASLLTVYLVTVRGQHLGGGIAFGLAVSIKLVPIVLAPLLLVLLLRRGLRATTRFTAGGLLVFLVLWLPVLVLRGPEFTAQVLNYSGVALSQWGIPQLLAWRGVSSGGVSEFRDATRLPALLIAAVVPAVLVWRRPQTSTVAFGLSFCLFLLLSPAFSMQYLVWPLAPAYLIGWRTATVYNVAASGLAYVVYANWNANHWWHWDEAVALPFQPAGLLLMTLAWASLLLVVVHGVVVATWRTPLPSESPMTRSARPTHTPSLS